MLVRSLAPLLLLSPPPPRASVRLCQAGFAELIPDLPAAVHESLSARGLHRPTPIQAATLPRAHAGESLLLHAETGSGKSMAFLLPALMRLGLAGAVDQPSEQSERGEAAVLVVAPTRELAVQLANEAACVMPAPGAVQIIAIGATPDPLALLRASVVTCTAAELLALMRSEGDNAGIVISWMSRVRALVLDELDMLLPVASTYGTRAAQRKKAEARKESAVTPAEELVRVVVETASADDLQVLAASATMSRPTRLKLARVLRRDPLGRWYNKPPQIIRPAALEGIDLSTVARAVVVPAGVTHRYVKLASSVRLKRLTPAAAAKRAKPRRLTLKQKRAAKATARKQARRTLADGELHPLLVCVRDSLAAVEPSSALVFLCRSSGLTVRRASRELRKMGLPGMRPRRTRAHLLMPPTPPPAFCFLLSARVPA